MPTICPKCRTLRPADATVPDWQCPACGVAYAKAGGDASAVPAVRRAQAAHVVGASHRGGDSDGLLASVPWGKLLACAAIVYGAWLGFHRSGAGTGSAGNSRLGANPTIEQLAQLAASSQASDVLMYSATWCPNCTAAKGWMGQYGFKAQVCEIDKDSSCLSQLKVLDPQGGVPYVIVKGHHMKDGFNSDEFVAALAR